LLDYEVVGKAILYELIDYHKLPMGTWPAVTPCHEEIVVLNPFERAGSRESAGPERFSGRQISGTRSPL